MDSNEKVGGAVDVAINASTAGMNADDALPFDPALLRSGAVVADFVTKGDITPLLARARSLGLAFVTGAQIAASQVDLQTSWFQMQRFRRAPRET